jgi:hypothetical protein
LGDFFRLQSVVTTHLKMNELAAGRYSCRFGLLGVWKRGGRQSDIGLRGMTKRTTFRIGEAVTGVSMRDSNGRPILQIAVMALRCRRPGRAKQNRTGRNRMRQNYFNARHRWAGTSAAALAFALLQASPAIAQADDNSGKTAAQDKDQTQSLDSDGQSDDNEIVVTGTGTNISGVKPVGS